MRMNSSSSLAHAWTLTYLLLWVFFYWVLAHPLVLQVVLRCPGHLDVIEEVDFVSFVESVICLISPSFMAFG